MGLHSGAGSTGSGKSTYQHPDRRDWWQTEASPLRAQVSAGTPPRHHGSQRATQETSLLRQKQQHRRTPQGWRQLHLSPTLSNRGSGGGGGNSEGADKAPRVEPVGNLGDLGAACSEPAGHLPSQNRPHQSAPSA